MEIFIDIWLRLPQSHFYIGTHSYFFIYLVLVIFSLINVSQGTSCSKTNWTDTGYNSALLSFTCTQC